MAKPALTTETILAAIGKIAESGENPTQNAVRKHLGQGSYTTIGDVLRDWRANQERSTEIAAVEVPDAVKNAAEQLLRGVYDACRSDVEVRLSAERQALADAQLQLQEAEQQAGAMADAAESEMQEAQAELEASQERLRMLESDAATAQQRVFDLEQRLSTADAQLTELRGDNETLKLSAERCRGESEALNKQLQETMKRVDAEEAEVRKLLEAKAESAALLSAKRELESAKESAAEWRIRLEKELEAGRVALDAEREAGKVALDAEREARSDADRAGSKLEGRVQELESIVSRANTQAGQDREELAALRDALAASEKRASALAAENELLKKQQQLPLQSKSN